MATAEQFPGKLYVRLEPDSGRPDPNIEVARTIREHAGQHPEMIAEYVLNKIVTVRLVTTENLIVEDAE